MKNKLYILAIAAMLSTAAAFCMEDSYCNGYCDEMMMMEDCEDGSCNDDDVEMD